MRDIQSFAACLMLALFLTASISSAQQKNSVNLGSLSGGREVSFFRTASGKWGIEISDGTARLFKQEKPAQFEIFRDENNVSDLAVGYESVQKENGAIIATAKVITKNGAGFDVADRWNISGSMLQLSRRVTVTNTEDSAGFYSAISLSTEAKVKWKETEFLAPGLLYGCPHTRASAPGGSLNYDAKRLSIREDFLSAPLFGILLRNGNWMAVLDLAPDGATTLSETTAPATETIIDKRIRFGALGADGTSGDGIETGFRLPGTTNEFSDGFFGGGRGGANEASIVRRRYNPVDEGYTQNYRVGFLFGKDKSLNDMERKAWRRAWRILKPEVMPMDVKVVYRTLIDHLADRVLTVGDRAGIPFVIDAVSGRPGSYRPALLLSMYRNSSSPFRRMLSQAQPTAEVKELAEWAKSVGINMDTKAAELELWPKITMGFCGKNIEAAGQFLRESYNDHSVRGQRMRKLGLMIISSFIRLDPMSPFLSGEGFDIHTGKASAVRGKPSFSLRATGEGMRAMIDAFNAERAHGHLHSKWFAWVKIYSDWLLTQQREDGSFPESFQGGTGNTIDSSGATSYAVVPLLVKMTEETADKKYLNSAIRAAKYIWTNFGSKCVYLGATGGDVADKESGMLSLEAFLSLYENTKDSIWLQRAEAAGDYTESWIWLWNVPMPIGAEYSELGWKPGVSTVGVTGIGSNDPGGVDEYLDWAVSAYARLYKYTNDKHYLYVARVLLHDTKSMLALPGRTYDLKGPGWQQEHWRMGPGPRGVGAHRTWLPWISVNHLHSITGLEELGPALFEKVSKDN